eukprot:TRINITY_DN61098_c0_g1_i1.p1 TRINITY_DN61098_c0_g1~~TRINITY_DN61098_c0_g1_i1.p1  ORF type:complete len:704 (+),score=142.34 TRINITY_DN61098_c0_g1_i1:285-2396(+)
MVLCQRLLVLLLYARSTLAVAGSSPIRSLFAFASVADVAADVGSLFSAVDSGEVNDTADDSPDADDPTDEFGTTTAGANETPADADTDDVEVDGSFNASRGISTTTEPESDNAAELNETGIEQGADDAEGGPGSSERPPANGSLVEEMPADGSPAEAVPPAPPPRSLMRRERRKKSSASNQSRGSGSKATVAQETTPKSSWFLASNSGQDCNSVCGARGMACSIMSEAKMRAAASSEVDMRFFLGDNFSRMCKKGFEETGGADDDSAPYFNPSRSRCQVGIATKVNTTCKGSTRSGQRICHCEVASWTLASGGGKSCDDACNDHSMVCTPRSQDRMAVASSSNAFLREALKLSGEPGVCLQADVSGVYDGEKVAALVPFDRVNEEGCEVAGGSGLDGDTVRAKPTCHASDESARRICSCEPAAEIVFTLRNFTMSLLMKRPRVASEITKRVASEVAVRFGSLISADQVFVSFDVGRIVVRSKSKEQAIAESIADAIAAAEAGKSDEEDSIVLAMTPEPEEAALVEGAIVPTGAVQRNEVFVRSKVNLPAAENGGFAMDQALRTPGTLDELLRGLQRSMADLDGLFPAQISGNSGGPHLRIEDLLTTVTASEVDLIASDRLAISQASGAIGNSSSPASIRLAKTIEMIPDDGKPVEMIPDSLGAGEVDDEPIEMVSHTELPVVRTKADKGGSADPLVADEYMWQ